MLSWPGKQILSVVARRYDRSVTFDTVDRNVSDSFRALGSVSLLRSAGSAGRRCMVLSALNYATTAALRVTNIAV